MSWPWLIVSVGTVIGLWLLIADLLQLWTAENDAGSERDAGLLALGRAVERARRMQDG